MGSLAATVGISSKLQLFEKIREPRGNRLMRRFRKKTSQLNPQMELQFRVDWRLFRRKIVDMFHLCSPFFRYVDPDLGWTLAEAIRLTNASARSLFQFLMTSGTLAVKPRLIICILSMDDRFNDPGDPSP